ncbi:NAD-dependent succinate-semialdehyde dehydrogenase [Hoeflea sp. WL0058]|uniref:NAD-dependent succinate-semialdehyde dehydrogenase n=1 Tax=Flavimaribacter sediminis TaxID=2865987 RepID=A0AAE2ZKW0_9HYPH|nr:NAD-dependent succinate-semialdehyde dehydrogenase [Flavimaribacter sediminis]MBW8638719.1 NAD-dependent succinate-semialdehyde dehydrogenase [Flavimaribacter sediminis]
MTKIHLGFVNGAWQDAPRETTPCTDPATNEVIGAISMTAPEAVPDILDAAERGFAHWRHVSPAQRGEILRRAAAIVRRDAEAHGRAIVCEQGKPLGEARIEVAVSAEMIDWSAAEGQRQYGRIIAPRDPRFQQFVKREPVGVCLLIPSWNVPLMFVARKLSEALAAGCSAILIGNKQVPSAATAVVLALAEAGVPEGVVNLVFGSNTALSEALLSSGRVAKLSFTGSTRVGRTLSRIAADHVVKTTLELGGHAPTIIDRDVDVEAVAATTVSSKYRNCGQVCNSPTRLFVHREIYDRFAEAFSTAATGLRLGHGLEDGTQMGPLASARQLQRIEMMTEDARAQGGRVLTGGAALEGPGNFFAPTVVDQLPERAAILREEPFGPIAALIAFDDVEAAIAQANALPFGLAAYCYTNSIRTQHRVSNGLNAGMIGINTPQISLPETPFGGVGLSGNGSEGGAEGVAGYMTTKYVSQFVA